MLTRIKPGVDTPGSTTYTFVSPTMVKKKEFKGLALSSSVGSIIKRVLVAKREINGNQIDYLGFAEREVAKFGEEICKRVFDVRIGPVKEDERDILCLTICFSALKDGKRYLYLTEYLDKTKSSGFYCYEPRKRLYVGGWKEFWHEVGQSFLNPELYKKEEASKHATAVSKITKEETKLLLDSIGINLNKPAN